MDRSWKRILSHGEDLEKRITYIRRLQESEKQIIFDLEKGNSNFNPAKLNDDLITKGELRYHNKQLKEYEIKEGGLVEEYNSLIQNPV